MTRTAAPTLVLVVVMAGALVLIGRWGRSHASDLVLTAIPEPVRSRKLAAVRRGGFACYVAAAALLSVGLIACI